MGLNSKEIEQIFQQQKEKLKINMDLALDLAMPGGSNNILSIANGEKANP